MATNLKREPGPGASELMSEILGDIQQLVRQELNLARAELRGEWKKVKRALVVFSWIWSVGLLSIVLASVGAVSFLIEAAQLPAWLSLWMVAGVQLLLVLFVVVVGRLRRTHKTAGLRRISGG